MNPYHEPTTAAAIQRVGHMTGISRAHSEALLYLIDGADASGFPSLTQRRAIEIVLSKVGMHAAMRRDLMLRLQEAILAELAAVRFNKLTWIRCDLSAWGERASGCGVSYSMTWTYRGEPEVWFEVSRDCQPDLIYEGGDEDAAKAAAQADFDLVQLERHAAKILKRV